MIEDGDSLLFISNVKYTLSTMHKSKGILNVKKKSIIGVNVLICTLSAHVKLITIFSLIHYFYGKEPNCQIYCLKCKWHCDEHMEEKKKITHVWHLTGSQHACLKMSVKI